MEKDGITRNKEEAVNDNLPTAFHIDHKGNYLLLKIKSLMNQIFQRLFSNSRIILVPCCPCDGKYNFDLVYMDKTCHR